MSLLAERTEKKCSRCQLVRPIGDFHKSAARTDGHTNNCKFCMVEIGAEGYARRGDRYRRHGITEEEYDAMVEAQGESCALCQDRPIEVIDHCHATGRVRGLLCRPCNTGLGNLGDTPEAVARALTYITDWTP